MTLAPIETLIEQISAGNKVQVGRNLITQKIGEGGFAQVFLGAFDEYGRRKAAIKFPKNEEAIPNIRTRQRILSALGTCPYIPNLVDQGTHEGTIFVAEEYREKSLADEIEATHKQTGWPSAEQIIDLGKHLLKGIDYFHRLSETNPKAAELLGIDELVHCDIKPSNVLKYIDPTGDIIWQYTDFGVQSKEEPTENGIKLSFQNSVSVQSIKAQEKNEVNIYAAPEVRDALLMDKPVPATQQSDLWSIGAILYKYATCRTPEWGKTIPQRTDLPNNLKSFFGKILAGNPEERFRTAQEALQSLENTIDEDSHIYGMSRTGKGKYQLFKQPMLNGKQTGTMQTYDFESTVFEPQMLHVPGMNRIALLTANQTEKRHVHDNEIWDGSKYLSRVHNEECQEIHLHLFDENLNPEKYTILENFVCKKNERPVTAYNAQILQNKQTGQPALRFEHTIRTGHTFRERFFGGAKYCDVFESNSADYDLTSPAEKLQALEGIKTGVFSQWKPVEKTNGVSGRSLRIRKGKIITGFNDIVWNPQYELEPNYVIAALWVPK